MPRIDYKSEFEFLLPETGDDRARKCDSRKGQTINYPGAHPVVNGAINFPVGTTNPFNARLRRLHR